MVVAKTELALLRCPPPSPRRELDRAYLALGWGVPAPAFRRNRGCHRSRQARSQADGGPHPRRQALPHPLPHTAQPGRRGHPVGMSARHRADAPDSCAPRRPRQTRWSETRSICVAMPAAASTLPEPVRLKLLDFPRQALHAARLGFAHPRTGAALSFSTEPPADMLRLIDALGCELRPTQG